MLVQWKKKIGAMHKRETREQQQKKKLKRQQREKNKNIYDSTEACKRSSQQTTKNKRESQSSFLFDAPSFGTVCRLSKWGDRIYFIFDFARHKFCDFGDSVSSTIRVVCFCNVVHLTNCICVPLKRVRLRIGTHTSID